MIPPRQLVGRQKEIDDLSDLLLDGGQRVIGIEGIPGVGKSTLGNAVCRAYIDKCATVTCGSPPPQCFVVGVFPLLEL